MDKNKLVSIMIDRVLNDKEVSEKAKSIYCIMLAYADLSHEILETKDIATYSAIHKFEDLLVYLGQLKKYLKVTFSDKKIKHYKFNLLECVMLVKPKENEFDKDAKDIAIKIVVSFYKKIDGISPNFGKDVGIVKNLLKKYSENEVVSAMKWCLVKKKQKMYNLSLFPYLINEALSNVKQIDLDDTSNVHTIPLEQLKEYIVQTHLGLYEKMQEYEKAIKDQGVALSKEEFKKIKYKLGLE